MNSDVLTVLIALGAVIVALITFYIIRRGKENTPEELPKIPEASSVLPLKGDRTVTSFDAQKSKKELSSLLLAHSALKWDLKQNGVIRNPPRSFGLALRREAE